MHEVHIPTISGKSSVLAISNTALYQPMVYEALVVQAGVTDPNATIVYRNDFEGTAVWSRDSMGIFRVTFSNFWDTQKTSVRGDYAAQGNKFLVFETISDSVAKMTQYASSGAVQDTLSATFKLTQYSTVPTIAEGFFDSILSSLDVNQTKLWIKIVVRNLGVVTEIDGNTYRKTNDYSLSSKEIES